MTSRYSLKLLYPRDEIAGEVRRMAERISVDYAGKDLLVIGVLKGAAIFLSDLVRAITIPVEFDFIGLASYGDRVTSCGEVKITAYPTSAMEGRHLLVVEDIVDTGLCVDSLLKFLKERNPASLKLCALLDKPVRRQVPVNIDYSAFTIPDKFVVGYGLDYAQRYRNLPGIHTLEEAADD
ncbi:hypoxanthine phosphoribosyltransferase [Dehalogenimonas sp. THU2]|uniref:hypoxanthine phosphoribosyltransferase n=1 Tax=Dehalogenimonas sp. THU2 TaxID=3151121 RepID=UPI0032183180